MNESEKKIFNQLVIFLLVFFSFRRFPSLEEGIVLNFMYHTCLKMEKFLDTHGISREYTHN